MLILYLVTAELFVYHLLRIESNRIEDYSLINLFSITCNLYSIIITGFHILY